MAALATCAVTVCAGTFAAIQIRSLALCGGGRRRPTATIGADAPSIRCLSQTKTRSGVLRIALHEASVSLLLARHPGRAEDAVPLPDAEISVQAATLVLIPKGQQSVTLWFDAAEDAESWAARLRAAGAAPAGAAGVQKTRSAPVGHAKSLAGALDQGEEERQRAQGARIAELEARVCATLKAAVDRSQRIRELEAAAEEGTQNNELVRELEDKVDIFRQEATARAVRIRELEAQLADGGCIRDEAASAILEDAMSFADQLLAEREECAVGDSRAADKLREVVAEVKESRPAVDRQVAELIERLVTALKWPLALQDRLEDAERMVSEQQVVQEHMQAELQELRSLQICDQEELSKAQAEVNYLTEQLCQAEDAMAQAEEVANQTAASLQGSGIPMHPTQRPDYSRDAEVEVLRGERDLEVERRTHAEEKAQRLRMQLDEAQQKVVELRQTEGHKALLNDETQAKLERLQQVCRQSEIKAEGAMTSAKNLREALAEAELAADEALLQQKEVLDAVHAEDLRTVEQLRAVAEREQEEARAQAEKLRLQLARAEQELNENATLQQQQLAAKHKAEMKALQDDCSRAEVERAKAEKEVRELRDSLATSSVQAPSSGGQLDELRSLQERHTATDQRRQQAEKDAQELRRMLAEARRAPEVAGKDSEEMERESELRRARMVTAAEVSARGVEEQRSKAAGDAAGSVGEELKRLQERVLQAEARRQGAEKNAQELARRLGQAEVAANQAVIEQKAQLDQQYKEELAKVRAEHAERETAMDQVQNRASELQDRLASAEASLHTEATRTRELLSSEAFAARRDQTPGRPEAGPVRLTPGRVAQAGAGSAKAPLGSPSAATGKEAGDHWRTMAEAASCTVAGATVGRPGGSGLFPLAGGGGLFPSAAEELDKRLAAAQQMVDQTRAGYASSPVAPPVGGGSAAPGGEASPAQAQRFAVPSLPMPGGLRPQPGSPISTARTGDLPGARGGAAAKSLGLPVAATRVVAGPGAPGAATASGPLSGRGSMTQTRRQGGGPHRPKPPGTVG